MERCGLKPQLRALPYPARDSRPRPSRLFKMWTSEGGIRVPCIVRYPVLGSKNPKLSAGQAAPLFQTCMDIMPTLLDLGGVSAPGKTFRGREVVPIRGKSWVPWFEGKEAEIHKAEMPVGWELHGCAGLRMGDWKILYLRELACIGRSADVGSAARW